MTLDEYREDDARRTWLRALLASENMQEVMTLMAEMGPSHDAVARDVTPQFANIHLGMVRGYASYEDTLKLLATPIRTEENADSNYQE